MKLAVVSVLAVAGAVSASEAAVVSYMTTIPVGNTNWNMNPSLPQWDPALFPGQTLQSVMLTVKGSVEGDALLESLDNAPSVINYGVSATITATAPGGLLVNVLPLAGGAFNATAFDGTIDFGGTSGLSLLNLSNMDTQSNMLTDPPDGVAMLAYIGNGSVIIPTVATGSSSASGAGNLITQFRTFAGAELTIKYTYVPAPGAAALLGLGGLIAARRRRA